MPNWTIALKDARWPRVFGAMWSVAGQAKKRLSGHWRALERKRASPVSVSCAAFAFVLACATAHADVKDGVAAYRRHDYAAALREFQEAGRHDDMHALNYLGIMYAEGLGTPRDDETAAAYFYKASVLGYPEAMANMGRMHELGLGVKRDYQTAISEYRAAANAGFKPAIMRMVEIFEKGELGLAPNAALADEWRARMRTSAPSVNSIEAVTVTAQKRDILIRVAMGAPPLIPPTSFAIANPARIVFDFWGTASRLGTSAREVNEGGLSRLKVVQAGDRTRIVVNLKRMMQQRTRIDGADVLITLSAKDRESSK
jgi:hypothetical protein